MPAMLAVLLFPAEKSLHKCDKSSLDVLLLYIVVTQIWHL